MFECSSAKYFEPRSITDCGTCDDAALSKYTSGFPFTVCDRTGKSARIFSTSHAFIVDTAFMFGNLLSRGARFTVCRVLSTWPQPALPPRILPTVLRQPWQPI